MRVRLLTQWGIEAHGEEERKKKHKDDSHGGSAMTTDEFCNSLTQTCPGRNLSKDVSDRNLVAQLKELFGSLV